MNIHELRAASYKAAQDIMQGAKAGGRQLTSSEQDEVREHIKDVKKYDEKIAQMKQGEDLMGEITNLGGGTKDGGEQGNEHRDSGQAKTLGEHFVQHASKRLAEIRGVKGASVAAPEFKAATDTQTVGTGSVYQMPGILTDLDRTVVRAVRPRLIVADLLGAGTISGNAITYFIEGLVEGSFTTVAEAGTKPQLHVTEPTTATDTLKKIAGFIKLSDEMMEDLAFVVSEINGRLLYELARFEEAQLLSGDGAGSNVLGLLNRPGLQTEAHGTAASGDTVADTLFRAMTKVSTGSGLDADGIVINPLDYQTLRLARDGNQQYYGGGYFQGQYGNGGVQENPPIWGLRTVVSPAVAQGTALVGAFAQAATVYRKGGVRVESTNSHASDFTSNLVTTRAEERIALAVRRPAGVVNVNLVPAV